MRASGRERREEERRSALNKEIRVYVALARELLNGAELILFPLERHFLSTIQRRCVKSQDATRGFMVVRSREAAEVSRAEQVCFLKQSRVSSSLYGNALIVWPYCGCLYIFFFFFTKVLIEELNVFHVWLSQEVGSNSENQRVHKLLLLKNTVQFGVA